METDARPIGTFFGSRNEPKREPSAPNVEYLSKSEPGDKAYCLRVIVRYSIVANEVSPRVLPLPTHPPCRLVAVCKIHHSFPAVCSLWSQTPSPLNTPTTSHTIIAIIIHNV